MITPLVKKFVFKCADQEANQKGFYFTTGEEWLQWLKEMLKTKQLQPVNLAVAGSRYQYLEEHEGKGWIPVPYCTMARGTSKSWFVGFLKNLDTE